jgi:hypothetical protein
MGTFAQTATVGYSLSFSGQGNQLPFSVFVYGKRNHIYRERSTFTYTYIYHTCIYYICTYISYMYISYVYIYIHIYIYFRLKRRPRRFFLIRLPFAHRANGSLLFVRLLTKKPTEVIRLQTDLAD